jgi:CRP-like cAMP-binding protein
MTEEALNKISEQLDRLTALIALNIVKGMKPTEAILSLGAAGLDRNLIAEITGSTPATVSVRLSEAKAKNKTSDKKSSKKTSKKK